MTFKEKIDTKRCENALEALHNELGDIQAYKDLSNAVDSSVALVYRKADRAMYHVKTHTKSGYCFYDEIKVCK